MKCKYTGVLGPAASDLAVTPYPLLAVEFAFRIPVAWKFKAVAARPDVPYAVGPAPALPAAPEFELIVALPPWNLTNQRKRNKINVDSMGGGIVNNFCIRLVGGFVD